MQIVQASYVISCPSVEKCPEIALPEYAFIGRSNVGKSSLINMLTNKTGLAKTSSTPGKTQLINYFKIETKKAADNTLPVWYLVDLPGYGYAKVSQKNRKGFSRMIDAYIKKRKNLVNVFVLIDSRHQPQSIDIDFVNYLGENQIPFCIVFTKCDKEKHNVVKKNADDFLNALRENWEFLPASFISSAEKKTGQEDILKFIAQCNSQFLN